MIDLRALNACMTQPERPFSNVACGLQGVDRAGVAWIAQAWRLSLARHRRHSCAMHTLQATDDERLVSVWLGHASMQSTDPFLRANPTERLEMLDKTGIPDLKPGRFRAPDRLLAMLQDKPSEYSISTRDPPKLPAVSRHPRGPADRISSARTLASSSVERMERRGIASQVHITNITRGKRNGHESKNKGPNRGNSVCDDRNSNGVALWIFLESGG